MNPTPNQITACTDERQLCEWAAMYCTGENITKRADGIYLDVIGDDGFIRVTPYEPTSPTEKGEAQCWYLARKYGLSVDFETGEMVGPGVELRDLALQIAVVKAAIIAALNGEE